MIRRAMTICALLLGAALAASPAPATEPVFDDQAQHPQLLPKGSMEYELLLKRKGLAAQPKPAADAEQVSEALAGCDQIAPLSTITREKCEIRARQAAPALRLP